MERPGNFNSGFSLIDPSMVNSWSRGDMEEEEEAPTPCPRENARTLAAPLASPSSASTLTDSQGPRFGLLEEEGRLAHTAHISGRGSLKATNIASFTYPDESTSKEAMEAMVLALGLTPPPPPQQQQHPGEQTDLAASSSASDFM